MAKKRAELKERLKQTKQEKKEFKKENPKPPKKEHKEKDAKPEAFAIDLSILKLSEAEMKKLFIKIHPEVKKILTSINCPKPRSFTE